MALRRLALVTVALMVCQTAVFVVRPMTSYRILALGETSVIVGLVSATFALAPLALAIPMARLARQRRTGVGAVAIGGAILMTLGCVGLAFMHSVLEAVLASIALGAGHLGIMLALQLVITNESPDREYDRNFAWFTVGASIGQLLGPVIGTAALSAAADQLSGTTTAMLLAAGAASSVVLLSLPLLPRGANDRPAKDDVRPKGSLRGIVGSAGAPSAIYVGLVVLACIDVLTSYLPVLGEEQGIAPFVVGLLLSVRAAASIASRLLIGTVSARMSRAAILIGSAFLAALSVAALTVSTQVWFLMTLMVVLGFALGFGQPLTMSWLVLLVPVAARGDALALRLMGNRLGQVLAPGAAAMFSGAVGTRSVFWMLGGLLGSSAWLVHRFRSRHGEAG